MKKIILAVAVAAIAAMAVASSASAKVGRCEGRPTAGTATFTALQPKDTENQFTNVWQHDFTVIVNADGTFSGTGTTTDNGGPSLGPKASLARSTLTRRVSASRPCPSVAARRSR